MCCRRSIGPEKRLSLPQKLFPCQGSKKFQTGNSGFKAWMNRLSAQRQTFRQSKTGEVADKNLPRHLLFCCVWCDTQ